jgi:sulfatase modifying factor 1
VRTTRRTGVGRSMRMMSVGFRLAESSANKKPIVKPLPKPASPLPEIEMAEVKGGCFQMGDTFGDGEAIERPVHEVCLSDFAIGKYPVTQAQWVAVMGSNPSEFQDGPDFPVENVNLRYVQKFIDRLNAMTGKHYRLPTEAEWEYAARSGGRREKWAGTSDESKLADYAWYAKNSTNKTHPVGTKNPNGLGLYDMSGNVMEWVQDRYAATWYGGSPKDNPHGPSVGQMVVARGGAWFQNAPDLRTSHRLPIGGDSIWRIGFRLAASRNEGRSVDRGAR